MLALEPVIFLDQTDQNYGFLETKLKFEIRKSKFDQNSWTTLYVMFLFDAIVRRFTSISSIWPMNGMIMIAISWFHALLCQIPLPQDHGHYPKWFSFPFYIRMFTRFEFVGKSENRQGASAFKWFITCTTTATTKPTYYLFGSSRSIVKNAFWSYL